MATTDNQMLHNYLKTKIDMDGVIPDYMLPAFALDELRKQEKKLATLREAGEKMAEVLRYEVNEGTLTDEQTMTALIAWEAANK